MKYCLGILPPDSYLDKIFEFQKKWKSVILPRRTEPHITVKSKIGLADNMEWLNRMQNICSEEYCFDVKMTKADWFSNSVLFLKATSDNLINLHKKLLQELLINSGISIGPYEGENFLPHMSIAKIIDSSVIADLKRLRMSAEEDFQLCSSFKVTKLYLYSSQDSHDSDFYTRFLEIPLK
jgi:2'-5' RNA ligase